MLVRVALHQTRLRTPGLGLDGKGVAMGAKALILLPSLDRLVAFLALYTRSGSLEDVLRTLQVAVVKSKLGAREVTLTFSADGSDRMDRFAEIAKLAGGYTFTGTSRHFVQYRDAAAPFGYDASELTADEAALALYHTAFTQSYAVERTVEVSALLLRLMPQLDPSVGARPGPKWIATEKGLGPALIGYFVRSAVEAEVGIAEWPPSSSFDDAPTERYLFRLPELPPRMLPLLSSTPGMTVFEPAAEGVGVEIGFRHPVNLKACPVFPREGLVLFRGHGEPLELARLPALGGVSGFARMELHSELGPAAGGRELALALETGVPDAVRVALRMVPTTDPWRNVTATWLSPADLPLLRRIAYLLGPETLRRATVAFTAEGAFVRHPTGIEAIPVGQFCREIHPNLYIPAGYDPLPAVAPSVLYESIGATAGQVLFIGREGRIVGLDATAFVSLEAALLEAQAWAPLAASELEAAFAIQIPIVELASPGLLPMGDVTAPAPEEA